MSTSTRTSPAVAGFTVKKEAPMPEGFPAPGPVGEVVVKEYPSYRMARSSGSAAFGRLFMHIKRNDIPMTAPVEMTMDLTEDGRLRQRDMAFLYESPTKGRTGSTGRVTILDQGRSNVLSIGLRGPLTPEKLASARQSVETRLANTPGWRTAGDFRLMGYNSPFVPASQRFYELQLPVVREDSATE
jgi:SOUL heme-binding protein